MAQTNVTRRGTGPRTAEGGAAAHSTDLQSLRRSVMACLLYEGTFYESGQSIADRIAMLTHAVAPDAAAHVAVEARSRMFIRHAPLLIAKALLTHPQKATVPGLVANTINLVIQRADELSEFAAMIGRGGMKARAAKVGLARAFTKFDAYQLAKYDRANTWRLRDVLFLTHAKPRDAEQAAVWKALVDGTLPAPDTWEVSLSAGRDKRETFERLLHERKLGGLALLRNLRNMTEAGVDLGLIRQAIGEHAFRGVLPFRFLSAARHAVGLEFMLEDAMLRVARDLPRLSGRTALAIDVSGSMSAAISPRSEISRRDTAAVMGALLREMCDEVQVYAFGTTAARVPARRGFAMIDAVGAANVGHATNVGAARALADRDGYDRIMVVTDMQVHDSLTAPLAGAQGYVVNVAPYRQGIGYGNGWTNLDGWSDQILRYMAEYEALTATEEG